MSKPYPPLYEPGAPPPALFILTSQTDIFYNPLHSSTVIANEELPPNLQTKRHRSVPPVSKASSLVRFRSVPIHQNDSIRENSDSSLTSLSGSDVGVSDGEGDTDESDGEGDNKIPKPPGEAGRPGRGGYTLRAALSKWDPKDYKKLQNYVEQKVNDILDPSKSYAFQKQSALGLVRQVAIEQFPTLDNYVDCWPVNDMLMARLKTTSTQIRKRKREKGKEKELTKGIEQKKNRVV